MEIYIEIDFDSGTRRYSRIPLRLPDTPCDPRVLSFGGIQREIGLVPGDYRAASVSFALSNVDGEFSQLRSTEPWRNRIVRAVAIDLDQGIGSQYTAFIGRIATWSIDKDQCQISAVDWIQSRLLRPVSGVIDVETYPDLPDETPRALIPLVIGEVASPGGAVPAYLVDPDVVATGWRYVMAQGRVPEPDEVYAYGVLVAAIDYTINYDDGPGGIECTYIDFDADPRTSDSADPHVSWNGSGITDDQTETGSAIPNGAEQLALFLRLNGFASNDLDLNTIVAAAAELTASDITGAFVAADADLTVGDVVRQFAESYNLQVFTTQTGLVGMAAPAIIVGESADVPEVTALLDVVRGSFSTGGRDEVASTLMAAYARNFFTGEFTAQATVTNPNQIVSLGEDVVLRQEFPFIRDATAMAAAAAVKMFFLREQRQGVQVVVPPHWYSEIDIGSVVKLNHFAAVGDQESEAEDHQTANLVALWRIDEGTGQDLLDTSGEGNDGELGSTSGADADDPDWIAEGLDFDGVDDHVRAPFLVDPDASDFTAWAIFRASAAGARRVILSQLDGTGAGRVWLEIDENNFVSTHIGVNVNPHSIELEAGVWYAATVRKFGGTVSLFLEGGDKEDFSETAEASDGGMLIGGDEPGLLEGILTDDLVAFWRFDEGSGDVLTDYSGNANHGQLGNSAGADADDPDWVLGGLDFPNSDDRVTAPFLLNPNTTDFTVLMALRVSSDATLRIPLKQAAGSGTGRTWLRLESTHQIATFGSAQQTHTTVLTPDEWYVACLRKSGGTLSLFIDGADKQDFSDTFPSTADGVMHIGNHDTVDFPFLDTIALCAVYSNDLTDQQVADVSAAMAQILSDRLASVSTPVRLFDDRMALLAVYDDAMSDTLIAANTVSLKLIVNRKIASKGFYRVLGSGLISVGPSIAAALRAVDLAQENFVNLFVPPVPESIAESAGIASVTSHARMAMLAEAAIAGSSVVTANASQNFITSGLQHLWLFNEGSGQAIIDHVGSSDGQLGSSSGADTNDPSWISTGLQFDGIDNYAQFPHFLNPSSGSWTVLLIFRSRGTSSFPPSVLAHMQGSNSKPLFVDHLNRNFYTEASNQTLIDGNLSTDVWYMGYARRITSPSSLRLGLIKTGQHQSSTQNNPTMENIGDGVLWLGRGAPSFEFWADMDAALMAHYDRALSDSEITTMFNGVKAYLAADRSISL
jgi:hypothetical protein